MIINDRELLQTVDTDYQSHAILNSVTVLKGSSKPRGLTNV